VSGKYVGSKSAQILTPALGVKYFYNIDLVDKSIQPGLQLSVAKDVVNRASGIETELMLQESHAALRSSNKSRTTVFLTPSITYKGQAYENSLSYSMTRAKKTFGHAISLKTAISF
jgi:hypothetical protein